MSPVFWLALRELLGRRLGSGIAVVVIALSTAFLAGLEFLGRTREAAVSAEMDRSGPALRLIPQGRTARDLARFDLQDAPFRAEDARQLRGELKRWVAAIEGRLLLKVPFGKGLVPVIGIEPDASISPLTESRALAADAVLVGSEAAGQFVVSQGAQLKIHGNSYTVAGILPQTGSAEDSALFMRIDALQGMFGLPGAMNELRVFPAPGADIEAVAAYIAAQHPNMSVLDTGRGEAAERSINAALRESRGVLYLIIGLIIAASVLMWSYLNGSERKVEMATVAALGASAWTVVSMIVTRGALLGFGGAVLGFGVGIIIALAQDVESAMRVLPSLDLGFAVVGFATVLSAVGSAPVAAFVGLRDPVCVLQEA